MRIVLGFLWLGVGAFQAQAAVLHVPSDYATINAALDDAGVGDSVLVAPGTYSTFETRLLHGGGPFTASSIAFLKGGISLIGEGGRDVTRIDLAGQGIGNAVPVMAYSAGTGAIVVQGFTITGAPTGNAGLWNRSGGSMTVRDCIFEDLDGGSSNPGGIYSLSADLEVLTSTFQRCRASSRSAAISHGDGHVDLVDCDFADCVGPVVVGLNAAGVNPPYYAEVRGCEFRDNTGLAATIVSFVTLTVEDCTFSGNSSTGASALLVSGGSGGIIEPGPYYVRGCLFFENSTTSGLGTFNWDRVSGAVERCTFVANEGRGLTITYEPVHAIEIRQNIFAGTTRAAIKFATLSSPLPTSACNDFWENSENNTEGFNPGPADIFVDPLFCGADSGDYTLAGNSPCLPPQSGLCSQIGALGEGCAGVSIESETWARMKAKYRTEPEGREGP